MNNPIQKITKTLIISLSLLAAASSQAVINDTFLSGSPADKGYYRYGDSTTLRIGSEALIFKYSGAAKHRAGFLKHFDSISLDAVGQSIHFSFILSNYQLKGGENKSFRWAIGNIKNQLTSDIPDASPFMEGLRRMYVFTAASDEAYIASNDHILGSSNPTHGDIANPIYGLDPVNLPNRSVGSVNIEMTITRTADGVAITRNFNGQETQGTLAVTDLHDFTFNTIAFSLNNPGDFYISIKDVKVSKTK